MEHELRNSNIIDLTTSLGRIVRYSLNEEFRKKCFELMNVDSTQKFETEINKKLEDVLKNGLHSETNLKNDTIGQAIASHTPTRPDLSFGKSCNLPILRSVFDRNKLQTNRTPSENRSQNKGWRHYSAMKKITVHPYGTLGQASLTQLVYSPHSGQGRYLQLPNTPLAPLIAHDRTISLPEKTRKVLFFDDSDTEESTEQRGPF